MSEPLVELFTHPACSGCQTVLAELSRLDRDGSLHLRVHSLATSEGQRFAQSLGVTAVPTVRVGGTLRELQRRHDLEALIEDLAAPRESRPGP